MNNTAFKFFIISQVYQPSVYHMKWQNCAWLSPSLPCHVWQRQTQCWGH